LATTQRYLHVNDEKLADKLRRALSVPDIEPDVEGLVQRIVTQRLAELGASPSLGAVR